MNISKWKFKWGFYFKTTVHVHDCVFLFFTNSPSCFFMYHLLVSLKQRKFIVCILLKQLINDKLYYLIIVKILFQDTFLLLAGYFFQQKQSQMMLVVMFRRYMYVPFTLQCIYPASGFYSLYFLQIFIVIIKIVSCVNINFKIIVLLTFLIKQKPQIPSNQFASYK